MNEKAPHYHENDPFEGMPGNFVVSAKSLAGNMSPRYGREDESVEERVQRARENMDDFIQSAGYEPGNAVIMYPTSPASGEAPLGAVNLDEVFTPGESETATELGAQNPGDFMYTYNPEVVMICRPADCPVVAFKGSDHEGKAVMALGHFGWPNLNAGHFEQAMSALIDDLGVLPESLQIHIGPGARKESFPYSNETKPGDEGSRFSHPDHDKLAVDVEYNQESGKYDFAVDTFGSIEATLEKYDIKPEQITRDGSDTAEIGSGYSSNSLAMRKGKDQSRDGVLFSVSEPSQEIIQVRLARHKATRLGETALR